MRTLLPALLLALTLAACGRQSDSASGAAKHDRIYDTQRNVLEQAKTVNDTVQQADQARREQEQRETQ